jgi:hypothetical protein
MAVSEFIQLLNADLTIHKEAESTTTRDCNFSSGLPVVWAEEVPDSEVPDIHTVTAVVHVRRNVLDFSAPYHVANRWWRRYATFDIASSRDNRVSRFKERTP